MNPAAASQTCNTALLSTESESVRERRGLRSACGAALCFLLTAFFGVSASAAPAHRLIADPPPALRAAGAFLVAEISIAVDNEAGLRDLLKDGAILELEMESSVERRRSLLGNAELNSQTRVSLLRHDPLSREFLLTRPGPEDDRELRDRNLSRLLYAGWKKLALPLIPLKTLRAEGEDEEFAVRLEITLRHSDVPPWLQKNFVFWSSEVAPQLIFTLPFAFGAGEAARP
ncbi:MAG: DUF4390 domain-containing protein [Desulfovibrio sp.]|jgi:hypothetical protein|nr:DUF4390 domain-containing protein [Desulfovibrio sp.]